MNCRGRWEADETPDTLSREFRARWTTRGATWNAFIGKPWQVGSRKMPPDTLSREFRGRWTAGRDTWNAFAGKTVAGGKQRRTPGTLLRGFRARWEAGSDTWNAFAGIPCQVDDKRCYLERFCGKTVAGGYMSAGTYCGTPPVLPAQRAPSLLGSRCRLRPLYVPVISHSAGPDVLTRGY